jgi:hypothetical protein
MTEQQTTVSLISTELAETTPDLIVSFALVPPNDPFGIENLILIRTPKYEGTLPPEEQGVSVSFDGNDDDEKGFLRAFKLNGNEAHAYTDTHHYSLNLRKVELDPGE